MNGARDEALRLGHGQLASQHLFRSLVDSGVAAHVLRELGHDLRTLQAKVELDGLAHASKDELELRSGGSGQLRFSDDAKQLLERAMQEAAELGHNYIGTEHLLLASLSVEPVAACLVAQGLERTAVQAAVLVFLGDDTSPPIDSGPALSPEEEAVRVELAALYAALAADLAQGHTRCVEETYAADAVLQIQSGWSVRGRAAAIEFFRREQEIGLVLVREPREVKVLGDVVVESGWQQWRRLPSSSSKRSTVYVAVWRRERGTWRIVRELAMGPV